MKIFGFLQGGLGNQLFIYASIRGIAEDKNANVDFDTSFFKNDKLYGRELELEQLGFLLKKRNLFFLRTHVTNRAFYKLGRLGLIPKVIYEPHFSGVYANYNFFIGYYQNEKYFSKIKSKLIEEYKSSFQYSNMRMNFDNVYDFNNDIVIHIRSYKESVTVDGDLNPSKSYYKDSIEALILRGKKGNIYVATDCLEFAKEQMPDDLVYEFIPENSGVNTFLLISCFNNIVCSNSSFSWWAAYLSGSNEVMYPSRQNLHYYPEPSVNWTLI